MNFPTKFSKAPTSIDRLAPRAVQIDNRPPQAIIYEPEVRPSGNKTDPQCGMLRYEPTDNEVNMPYKARHPRRFAIYRFRIFRSTAQLYMEAGQKGDMGSSGEFVLKARLKPDPTDPTKLNLLGKCPEVAFSENLYMWNMAFNG